MKKIIQRTCVGCNCKKDKRELIRLVIDEDGNITIDETRKKEGRGFYICGEDNCLNKIIKTKKLEKILQIKIEDEFYKKLQEVIANKTKQNNESKEGDGVE